MHNVFGGWLKSTVYIKEDNKNKTVKNVCDDTCSLIEEVKRAQHSLSDPLTETPCTKTR